MSATPPRIDAPVPAVRGSLFEPGRNCWGVHAAPFVRLVQDAAEYFRLARQAILGAEHSVFVLGWDIHARLDLVPDGVQHVSPTRLADLLDFVVRRRPGLHCHVLVWDHSTLYALERDPFTRMRMSWFTHRRVHFRFDDQHPLAASHHDKVLVVDDRIAFAGSIDLTTHRWDTSTHKIREPRRVGATGQPYEPYHDVQLMVSGDAAQALGEHARERWRRLGWRRLPPVVGGRTVAWPDGVPVDARNVRIAISRTEPAFRSRAGTRECEVLFHDAIAAARRWIYIENQYFTDPGVAGALKARLGQRDGPELVLVLPRKCHGWLEHNTIGALREQVLAELRASDRHGRLRLVCPLASRQRDVPTFVHSKVMIVDERMVRVGSANLARRSMGMDSECDLSLVAEGDAAAGAAVLPMLARLLGEHLGADSEIVSATLHRTGSLLQTIDALSGGDRSLVELEVAAAPAAPSETMRALVDPHEPIDAVVDIGNALPDLEASENRGRRVARVLPAIVLALAIAAAAIWVGGERAPTLAEVEALLTAAPHSMLAWAVVAIATAMAGVTFVPLYWLAVGAGFVLGIAPGAVAAYAGAMIGAAFGSAVGRALSPRRLAGWIGPRVYRLLRTMQGHDVGSVAMLRLAPVASVTTMHLLCGAAAVPRRAYWLGTGLGLLPTVAAAALIGGLLRRAVLLGEAWAGAAALLLACILVAASLRLRWLLLMQRATRALAAQSERSSFG